MRIDLCFLSAVCTAGRAAESDRRGTRALDLHKPEKRAKAKSSTSSHRSSRRATKRAQKFGGANSKDVDTGVDSRGALVLSTVVGLALAGGCESFLLGQSEHCRDLQ
mmetsp:Transcript_28187/g.110746  ORF Transcript_28187/g.110746 Transcript_28187/m.110746 type:complete len:107 (-) Transcript_28187:1375-1695(-)